MRLRPTQFVFLLLLACSVQVREECALQLTAAAVSGTARVALQATRISVASMGNPTAAGQTAAVQVQDADLDTAALAAHRAIWSMRRPAIESTAVICFSSFLRA